MTAPLVIEVPYSHLFPGLHLLAPSEVPQKENAEIILLFADGATTAADLIHGADGRITLHVAAYTTARETPISARVWRVVSITEGDGELDIHLGDRLPGRQAAPDSE
jgi:hypothetical protein